MKEGRTCPFIHMLRSACVLQRNLKVAQTLAREAENKRADAVRLAREFEAAKNAAKEAGQVSFSKSQCSYGVHCCAQRLQSRSSMLQRVNESNL